jgi:hypothetical protein
VAAPREGLSKDQVSWLREHAIIAKLTSVVIETGAQGVADGCGSERFGVGARRSSAALWGGTGLGRLWCAARVHALPPQTCRKAPFLIPTVHLATIPGDDGRDDTGRLEVELDGTLGNQVVTNEELHQEQVVTLVKICELRDACPFREGGPLVHI